MKRPALTNIQILRGIAALLVLAYHIPDDLTDRGWKNVFPIMWVGASGVDIFFVVSGFIMVYSTVGLFRTPGASIHFLLRRLARIVPLYWIFTTLYVVTTIRDERHAHPVDYTIPHFIASYLFAFYPRPGFDDFPIYRPGWSLNYEMVFYACFAVALLLSRPKGLAAISLGFIGLVGVRVAALHGALTLPWPIASWANTDLLEFVFGMVLAQAYLKGFRVPTRIAVPGAFLALMALMLTAPLVDDWFPYRGFVWGLPAAILVACAVLHEAPRDGALRHLFISLGDASYSLYLVHMAFFVGLATLLGYVMDIHRIPALWYGAMMFFGALGSAILLHRWAERPMTRGLQRWLNKFAPGRGPRSPDSAEHGAETSARIFG